MTQATSENERTITRLASAVWSNGDLDVLTEVVASDIEAHIPGVPEVRNREGYEDAVQTFRSSLPDFNVEVEELISADDVVVARYTVRGTHEGELMGIAPTGNEVEMSGNVIFHFEDGKIVEEWNQGDMLGLLQQIGAGPQQQPA